MFTWILSVTCGGVDFWGVLDGFETGKNPLDGDEDEGEREVGFPIAPKCPP